MLSFIPTSSRCQMQSKGQEVSQHLGKKNFDKIGHGSLAGVSNEWILLQNSLKTN